MPEHSRIGRDIFMCHWMGEDQVSSCPGLEGELPFLADFYVGTGHLFESVTRNPKSEI